jgi:hexokinase
MISFSFAHEIKHTPDMDGIVVWLSKELSVRGIVGEALGENLKKSLVRKGAEGAKVVVLNDTVGVACSMAHKRDEYDSFIGLVMGTGTNTSYIEKSENIKKISDAKSSAMFINVESAEFIPPRGPIDIELDAMTDVPGASPLEKMISGRYVGNLFWLTTKHAAEEGLLSPEFCGKFAKNGRADTIDLSAFLSGPYGDGVYAKMCGSEEDRAFLYTAAATLVARGARLIALEVAGAAMKSGKGRDAKRPICVVAEGTTYYTLKGLKEQVEGLLYGWLKEKGVYVKLRRVENAALKGIGVIGLSYME